MRKPQAAVLAVIASLALAACELETIVGGSKQAIIGGTADDVDTAAVLVASWDPTANKIFYECSGVVVSPHVIVTAAHCLDPRVLGNGPSGNPFSFLVFVGNDAHSSEGSYRSNFFDAKSTHIHPQFQGETFFNPAIPSYDVGAIVTTKSFSATPLPLNRRALDDSFLGLPLRIIGFGVVSDPFQVSGGKRYQFSTTIQGLSVESLWFKGEPATMCHGDSGGPALAVLDGREVVVGIHRGGILGSSGTCLGSTNYSTRADLFTSFLEPLVEEADPGFLPRFDAGQDGGRDSQPDAQALIDAGSPPADASLDPDGGSPQLRDPGNGAEGCSSAQGSVVRGAAVLAVPVLLGVRRRHRRAGGPAKRAY